MKGKSAGYGAIDKTAKKGKDEKDTKKDIVAFDDFKPKEKELP